MRLLLHTCYSATLTRKDNLGVDRQQEAQDQTKYSNILNQIPKKSQGILSTEI